MVLLINFEEKNMLSSEEKYPELYATFPDRVSYFFTNVKGDKLNFIGEMAVKNLELEQENKQLQNKIEGLQSIIEVSRHKY